jgi:hypothetical protein
LNEYGFPPSLIPLQKFPSYPYSYPYLFDSYGNFPAINQFPVLAPNYYPQQEHKLPPLDQPMFQVGARKLDQEPTKAEQAPQTNENLLPTISNNAIKNRNANQPLDVPDVEIPPIPFTIKKN